MSGYRPGHCTEGMKAVCFGALTQFGVGYLPGSHTLLGRALQAIEEKLGLARCVRQSGMQTDLITPGPFGVIHSAVRLANRQVQRRVSLPSCDPE